MRGDRRRMKMARLRYRGFACGVVIAALVASAMAAPATTAYGSDGVFVLARGFRYPHDVAMLPEGSVLASRLRSSVSAPTWRLWPDGRRVRVAGFDATGLTVAPDGSVLGIDGTSQVVRRWMPESPPRIVAGGASDGSSGDGGPALAARLSLDFSDSMGILPLPDGAFMFAETGSQRVRAVDAFGVIRTVAGRSSRVLGVACWLGRQARWRIRRGRSGALARISPRRQPQNPHQRGRSRARRRVAR